MQYLLLIYGSEAEREQTFAHMSEADQAAHMQRWFDLDQELRDAGVYVAGEALHPTATAQTVRVRDGEPLVTDGPFAETKEQLGGFYLIDVASREEALEWAAKIPAAPYGSVEARAVMVLDQQSA